MHAEHPKNRRGLLAALFDAGIAAVDAAAAMPRRLPVVAGNGRLVVIAIGKAAVPLMAAAQGRSGGPLPGLVVAPKGHVPAGTAWPGVTIITAGHPVPDADSLVAGEAALALAAGLHADDHLLMLVSGGGSALLAAPVPGVTLADKAMVTRALLRSGAAIAEINLVRKALSRIKGGRLAAVAAPARVTTWIVSDIPGDDPALVASGPTVAGGGSLAEAQAIVAHYGITAPDGVARALAGPANEPPAAGSSTATIIARPRDALDAIGRMAAAQGYTVVDLGDDLEGEARELAAAHGALALGLAARGGRHAIISGGETSVAMVGSAGRGGRNLEYALGLALALDSAVGIAALAADSDGIDGSSDAAGAYVGPDTLARATVCGLDAAAFLAANDAHGFFASIGDLVVTGPTLTNVNDLRVILVG
jgi:glycerate 2-kinase